MEGLTLLQPEPNIRHCKRRTRRDLSPYFPSSGPNFRLLSRHQWTPPRSPFNLIQENLFHDPWQLLVATIFLNRTGGARAVPLAIEFLKRWPDAESALRADVNEIAELMRPIGLNNRRANVIQRFSGENLILLFMRSLLNFTS